jgi:hypothetical protein
VPTTAFGPWLSMMVKLWLGCHPNCVSSITSSVAPLMSTSPVTITLSAAIGLISTCSVPLSM